MIISFVNINMYRYLRLLTMQHFRLPIVSHFQTFTVGLVNVKTTDEILMTETSSSSLAQLALVV